MDLAATAFLLSKQLPKSEQYGLALQLTRAATSVPANIAEGHGSRHRSVYLNHLSIARGSLMEFETHLLLAERTGMLSSRQTREALDQSQVVGMLLNGLIRSLGRPASG